METQTQASNATPTPTVPQRLAVGILSRAGRTFDEVVQCLAKGDQLGARNAVEYWQTVVCADDAEEIRKAGFSEENNARSALSDLYKTTALLRFDLLAERPARAGLIAFKRNHEALCQAERVLRTR